ncbi:hypothetical protein [Paenibacillus campi]|uniref:hypothetical protein n=1 Tax=Paenibacillus campi TaxID=3106031 RepID=UPI002B002D07|nr:MULTISPECIES: hypothetical protein [unclassified Paenibacillus]
MSQPTQHVPYGYEPPPSYARGTLIYYDSFQHISNAELEQALMTMQQMNFARLVLYPLHEQTVRRMSNEPVAPFYERERRLQAWKHDGAHRAVTVEGWDGKRKKYTPMEAALRTLIDHYESPYFLLLTPEMANRFASFAIFEEWIGKISLVLTEQPDQLHPRLSKFSKRWRIAGQTLSGSDSDTTSDR